MKRGLPRSGSTELRVPSRALHLAQRAAGLSPHDWQILNTLGLVYFRLGQFDAAVETLQRSIVESHREATAHNMFLLAMSYHRLGEVKKAGTCYDRAVRWLKSQNELTGPEVDELCDFQTEADSVLQLKGER